MTENLGAVSIDSQSGAAAATDARPCRLRNPWFRWCWCGVVAGYLLAGCAWLGPAGLERSDSGYLFFWYVAFLARTFQFHAGIVLAMVIVVCLVCRWPRTAAVAVPALLITVGPSLPSYLPHSERSEDGPTIRIMSANLLYLNDAYQPIIDEIRAVAPDVLLLQEYTDPWHRAIHPAISDAYPYADWVTRSDAFGLAIYSRRPLEPDQRRDLDCGGVFLPLLRSLIDFDGRRIAMYSVHMVPPMWGRLPLMRQQFRALCDLVAAETEPMVLAGDFNFTSESSMHLAIRDLGMADAHQAAGWGRGDTWPKSGLLRFVPGVRIDHVYLSKELTAVRCGVGEGRHSDHRPVIVDVAVRTQTGQVRLCLRTAAVARPDPPHVSIQDVKHRPFRSLCGGPWHELKPTVHEADW